MAIWTTIRRWLSRDRERRHLAERDTPAERDRHSTTDTRPSDTFVGPAGGDSGDSPGPKHRRTDDDNDA
jgi:hypothetical protein